MKVPLAVRAIPAYTWRAWLTPPPKGRRIAADDAKAGSDLTVIAPAGHTALTVGAGPLVLALHGWGGRPAQMIPLARRLAGCGYRVVAPDLPGHAGGDATDIKRVAAAVQAVVDELGAPEVIVGHSFASMVLRVTGITAPRVVLMAPLMRVSHALEVFSDRLGLLPWSRRRLRRRLRAWDAGLWELVDDLAPGQFPEADMLILHDPDDADTPFAASAELTALRPSTRIVAVEGSGHSGILASPQALDVVAAFATSRGAISA